MVGAPNSPESAKQLGISLEVNVPPRAGNIDQFRKSTKWLAEAIQPDFVSLAYVGERLTQNVHDSLVTNLKKDLDKVPIVPHLNWGPFTPARFSERAKIYARQGIRSVIVSPPTGELTERQKHEAPGGNGLSAISLIKLVQTEGQFDVGVVLHAGVQRARRDVGHTSIKANTIMRKELAAADFGVTTPLSHARDYRKLKKSMLLDKNNAHKVIIPAIEAPKNINGNEMRRIAALGQRLLALGNGLHIYVNDRDAAVLALVKSIRS